MKTRMKPQDVVCNGKCSWNAENLHIVVDFWPLKASTTIYCVICVSYEGSCLCLNPPRVSVRARPLQWVKKTIDLPLFLIVFGGWKLTLFQNVRSGINKGFRWQHHRNFQPGHGDAIRHKYEVSWWKGMVLSGINARTPVAIGVLSGIKTWFLVARGWCHQA